MIFLIGFMGSGKTTVGKKLAEELHCRYADTDELIENKYNMEVKEIFALYGESKFREMETETLKELEEEEMVIMTGGGSAGKKINRDLMKEKGKVIWLDCPFEELLMRIASDPKRPLVKQKGLEGIKKLFTEREPVYYSAADYVIKTSGLTIDEIVKEILSCLKIKPPGETR
ncbi:shikimate kinase [Bacillus salacetis]|uniref:Shikimate kinase n=1 Tax=Bacillus salacetis TaxID=2315464 RepID=A0A3A1QU48_9BACI|nr:shikimate kinase [Bacillus salacetis]RIW31077.1 shikimate kinase [Bacillus salacetis]